MKKQERSNQKWKGKSTLTTIIAAIVIALVWFLFPEDDLGESSRDGLIPVEFVRTLDGDTIRIMYEGEERKVRYLLIDTPETSDSPEENQPFAEEALKRNDELLNSGQLEIEFDVGDREDHYGRLLAYLYIDGESVQEKLLEEGLARVAYIYEPNTKHLNLFKKAENKAKAVDKGIWSIQGYVTNRGFNH